MLEVRGWMLEVKCWTLEVWNSSCPLLYWGKLKWSRRSEWTVRVRAVGCIVPILVSIISDINKFLSSTFKYLCFHVCVCVCVCTCPLASLTLVVLQISVISVSLLPPHCFDTFFADEKITDSSDRQDGRYNKCSITWISRPADPGYMLTRVFFF